MIEIKVSHPDAEPRSHRFEGPRIRIGRGSDNDLVLDSSACSRFHAEIVHEAGRYKIVDQGSTNGIRFQGKRVEELELFDGASVILGQHTLSISLPVREDDKTVLLSYDGDLESVLDGRPADDSQEPPVLYLLYQKRNQTQRFKIAYGLEYTVGRSPNCDLVLEDRDTSKRHAVIQSRENRFFIRDLGSANGTWLNGERISESPVAAHDRILIGRTEFSVRDEDVDLVDQSILLERTRLGIPTYPHGPEQLLQTPAEGVRLRKKAGAGIMLAAAAFVLLASVGFLYWQLIAPWLGKQGVTSSDERASQAVDTENGVIVQVVPVRTQELIEEVTGSGTIKPHVGVTVSAEIGARILEISIEEGSVVRQGEVLARLNDRDLRLQIQEAQSSISREQVELARQDYQRKERLFEDGVVTRSVFDKAKHDYLSLESAYRSTQAKIRQLEEQLGKTRIEAPISGVVARKMANPGEFLAPGAPIVLLEDTREVLVEIEVSDRDVVKVQSHQLVEASTDAFPNKTFRGFVDRVGTAANPVTRTFTVQALIGNQEMNLRSGMIASLRILLDRKVGLVIPAEGLIEDRETAGAVYVVRQGQAHRAEVKLGQRSDRVVEVLSGLAEGEEVIVYGQEGLTEGEPVRPYREPEPRI